MTDGRRSSGLLDGIDDAELEARALRHVVVMEGRGAVRADPDGVTCRRVTLAADRAGGLWPFLLRVGLA